MTEPASPVDSEYEKLKKRRLGVLNTEPQAKTDAFTLEDDGLAPEGAPVNPDVVRERIVAGLRTVHDPEIPLNIYDLGLIYELTVDPEGSAHVRMTLTAPGCPVAGSLVREVHDRVRAAAGVRRAKTELVWDPPWTRDRLSMEARLELGLL
jgi:FeS assembly SUF system protein